MIPALFTTLGLIAPEWQTTNDTGETVEHSTNLYYMASRYLLPAALVLMTLSIDLKAVFNLGWKALDYVLYRHHRYCYWWTYSHSIDIDLFLQKLLEVLVSMRFGEVLSTLAGSWIGGGANQTAMLEIYQYNPAKYGAMVFVDIVVANIWMALLANWNWQTKSASINGSRPIPHLSKN